MALLVFASNVAVRSRLLRRLSARRRHVVGVESEAEAEKQWMRMCFSAIVVAPLSCEDDAVYRRLRAAFGRYRPFVLAVLPGASAVEVRATLAGGADDVITSDDEGELEARLAVLEARGAECVPSSLLHALAAGVAHEIRNPLNGACLHVEVAQRALTARAPDDTQSALSAVRRDLARIEHLVDEFVAYAEARSSLVRADLVATTRRALERTAIERSPANLHVVLPTTPLYTVHDVERLSTAIYHLIRNGLDAAGAEGEVTATLRAATRDVQILVEDTGPGPRAGIDVFAPFAKTERFGFGLGLGLPTAQRIALQHGGYLSLSRHSGRTAASLVLPIAGCERTIAAAPATTG